MKCKILLTGLFMGLLFWACSAQASTDTWGTQADIAVSSTNGLLYTTPGDAVQYVLYVSNYGTGDASGVMLTDKVPQYATFDGTGSTPGWSCLPPDDAGDVVCSFLVGIVQPGQERIFTFAVTVMDPVPGGVEAIVNTASVSDDGTGGDSDTSNNTRTEQTPISPLFIDEFQDGTQSWKAMKGTWSEVESGLLGTAAPTAIVQAPTPWFPSEQSQCSACMTEIHISLAGGIGNKVFLQPWFKDNANRVDVLLKEESDTILIKHIAGGTLIAKGKASFPLQPQFMYRIRVRYEAGQFTLVINGTPVMVLPDGGVTPNGSLSIKVKNTSVFIPRVMILN